MTVPEMRAYISDMYGDAWKAKVAKMPSAQVIAIYFTFRERINKRKKSESLKAIEMGEALTMGFARGISEDNYEQVSFEDYLGGKL